MASSNKTIGKRRHSEVDGAEEQSTIRQMGSPFDSSDADCILRSSNGVDFRVHTLILSLASPFFRTMFSLPKGPTTRSSQEIKDGLPVVPVSEHARTLHILLSLCYPEPPPIVKQLRELTLLYEAAEKYEMDRMLTHIARALVDNASQDVVAAYAFGYRHQLMDLVTTAAKITLQNPLSDLGSSPELDLITGAQLQNLHAFHRLCRGNAIHFSKDWTWVKTISSIPLASATKNCDCQTLITISHGDRIQGTVALSEDRQVFYAPEWWYDYMDKATEALRHRPLGSTVMDPLFCAATFGAASNCDDSDCAEGVKLMQKFIESFATEIDQAVADVRAIHILSLYLYSIRNLNYRMHRLHRESFTSNRQDIAKRQVIGTMMVCSQFLYVFTRLGAFSLIRQASSRDRSRTCITLI